MTVGDFEIDMMELADLGQPTKIALEVHRQLRKQFDSVPCRMPLTRLADAVGIVGIEVFDGTSFEGTLVVKDGVGAIGIRRGLRSGRHNFTLAHEIGHFLIPAHRLNRQRFTCEPAHMRLARAGNFNQRPALERIEIEANEFAAALLVPMPEYWTERRRLGSGCDVSHVRALAETFDVSQEVMAKLYVNASDEKIAIITSKDDVVARTIVPQTGFPYLGLRKGSPLPANAVSRGFPKQAANDPVSNLVEVATQTWLDRKGRVSALYEQVFLQEDGWAMTMLLVDEEEYDEEADDRNWNRRSGRS